MSDDVVAEVTNGDINAVFGALAQDWIFRSKAWFPSCHDTQIHQLVHTMLGLGGEVGEIQNIIKKLDRDGVTWERWEAARGEVVDALCYLVMLGDHLGVKWSDEINKMALKNNERWGNPYDQGT